MTPSSSFYNFGLVCREHGHLCSLINAEADSQYTTMFSKRCGDITLVLVGKKSGKRVVSHSESFFNSGLFDATEDHRQPSHLNVRVSVHPRVLSDPVETYPCWTKSFEANRETFHFHDEEAFAALFERLDPIYRDIVPTMRQFFADWIALDAKRANSSAEAIRVAWARFIYSPDRSFYRTQTRSIWPPLDTEEREDDDPKK